MYMNKKMRYEIDRVNVLKYHFPKKLNKFVKNGFVFAHKFLLYREYNKKFLKDFKIMETTYAHDDIERSIAASWDDTHIHIEDFLDSKEEYNRDTLLIYGLNFICAMLKRFNSEYGKNDKDDNEKEITAYFSISYPDEELGSSLAAPVHFHQWEDGVFHYKFANFWEQYKHPILIVASYELDFLNWILGKNRQP